MNALGRTTSSANYTAAFYEQQQAGSRRSAEVIVPLVLELAPARTVIDVGCGLGTWLSVFAERGLAVQGIDGDHVDRSALQIPPERFCPQDLAQFRAVPQRVDLAVSLEVAEHLPPDCADSFVEALSSMAPVVLFSAAIPDQGGTSHVNEQWPEYWADKFARRGFAAVDCLRARIWNDARVEWWYAQNMVIYANDQGLRRCPALKPSGTVLSLVHPKNYLSHLYPEFAPPGLLESLTLARKSLVRAVASRTGARKC